LAGSGQYVRIVVEHVSIIDERMNDPEIEALDLTIALTPSESIEAGGTLRKGGFDVVIPIGFSDQGEDVFGVVQVGFSDTYARVQVRSHRILIFGITAGSWLVLVLGMVFIVRIHNLRSRLTDAESMETQRDGVIRCGALSIDTETCDVRLSEKRIELTPKTFELLTFLARNEGKTFSDADLLAALWADAPYAASGDVKQCVYMLRRHLKSGYPDPKSVIVNVKGFGYKLVPPIEVVLNPD
ncbi:winged helix-turn-helix domain-containing protein, partial [Candidatus Bipolaricaulota bacterium]|nr:winged helix-turn-helix domain-containing protein [Candidatus Bipolaricaulota bacterium]